MAGYLNPSGRVSTTQLAKLLLLSERRIQQLVQAGILKHAIDEDSGRELRGRFEFVESLHAYLRYKSDELGDDDVIEAHYLDARARRMAALAKTEELRLARLKGRMHYTEDVEFLLGQMLTAFRSRLLALPSRVSGPLAGKTDQAGIAELLQGELETALRELAGYDPKAFAAANEEYLAGVGAANPQNNGDTNGEQP